jgi:hypothetical protein
MRIDWAGGNDMRGLRKSTIQAYELCLELRPRHWLLNMNSFPDISVYDQMWLGTHCIPGLAQLPLERMVLVVSQRRVHNQLAIEALIALTRPFCNFDVQFFPQPDMGLHWLSEHSERVPALLAEWNAAYSTERFSPPALTAAPAAFYQPRP